MREHERELFLTARVALEEARRHLTSAELDTIRAPGSEYPKTWEDHLTMRAAFCLDSRLALEKWQTARNAVWVELVDNGAPEYFASAFRKKNRTYRWISKEDIEAEVMFALAYFIERYDPRDTKADFRTYAMRGMLQKLTEWAAQQGPLQLPEKVARKLNPREYRRPAQSAALQSDAPEEGE